MDVLEHVQEDRAMLMSIVAASQPGAYFLITVPAEPELWSPHDSAVGHYRRYTMASFQQLWADLPLRPLLVSPYNARLYRVVKLLRTASRWLRRSHGDKMAEGADLKVPRTPLNGILTAFSATRPCPSPVRCAMVR